MLQSAVFRRRAIDIPGGRFGDWPGGCWNHPSGLACGVTLRLSFRPPPSVANEAVVTAPEPVVGLLKARPHRFAPLRVDY